MSNSSRFSSEGLGRRISNNYLPRPSLNERQTVGRFEEMHQSDGDDYDEYSSSRKRGNGAHYFKIPWWYVVGGTVGSISIVAIAIIVAIKLRQEAKRQLARVDRLEALALSYDRYASSWRAVFGLDPIYQPTIDSSSSSVPAHQQQTPVSYSNSSVNEHRMLMDTSELFNHLQSQSRTLHIPNTI